LSTGLAHGAGPRLDAAADGAAILADARRVLRLEAEGIAAVEHRLDASFIAAVRLILESGQKGGRVIVSGVGKSGLVGRKIAATLTSTGTPALFLHPVEGLHGDLGIVGRDDVALLLSKSGESGEMTGLLEYLTRLGVRVVILTGRPESALARLGEIVIDCSVPEEACPHDLAPTTSTTATLAVGDAVAVSLLRLRGFSRDDFARLHPGGALGRKLTLRVRDVMDAKDFPSLPSGADMRRCVVLLASKRGTVPIVDEQQHVLGVVTAGDLTRLMERRADFLHATVDEVMTRTPRTIEPGALAAAAVYQMETHGIMAMPVVDEAGVLQGLVHLHDLLRANAV
jgi:arabinose-5-phosphate isomerase